MSVGNNELTYFILRGREIVSTDDVLEWAKFLEEKKTICHTFFPDNFRVSTVFLGFDYSGDFFESAVFDISGSPKGDCMVYMQRYKTYDEAEEGHFKLMGQVMLKILDSSIHNLW